MSNLFKTNVFKCCVCCGRVKNADLNGNGELCLNNMVLSKSKYIRIKGGNLDKIRILHNIGLHPNKYTNTGKLKGGTNSL